MRNPLNLHMLGPGDAVVEDAFVKNSFKLEEDYLLRLEPERLLAGFYETAGLAAKKIRYKGWESTEIAGHTMGHYLTALAQAWACTGNESFLEKLGACVEGLSLCQRKDGFVFASSEEIFDRVESKAPAWVPWYTMHKIISGLISVFCYTKDQEALKVVTGLGDWVSRRVLSWSEETRETVLAVEYGGMNDCLYDLYALTGNKTYFKAAHQFDEMPLFKAMAEKRDILNGLHANTTIPKMIGALKRYMVSEEKEDFYFQAGANFWDMVIDHHTYITGGNSEWEHFGRPDVLDAERTACNCETCNTYNMLKLSRLLFALTGEKKYADYDERAYINAILSSQNHETGMTTYFQPMATGYFKVYSRPFDQFWCCTGTGMENFSKPWAGIAFGDDHMLWINRYENAALKWKEGGLELSLQADFLKSDNVTLKVIRSTGKNVSVALRIPAWAAGWQVKGAPAADDPLKGAMMPEGRPQTLENGLSFKTENGYGVFTGSWTEGTAVELSFKRTLTVHGLADSDRTVAFAYGPFVLSSDLGKDDLKTTVTGVDVTVPELGGQMKDYLLLREDAGDLLKEALKKMVPAGDGKFTFTGADGQTLAFSPHFLKNQERYGIYYRIFREKSEALDQYIRAVSRRQALLERQREVIPLGNDQYELAAGIRGQYTDSTVRFGRRGRMARPGGWFSYTMALPERGGALHLTLERSASRDFHILFEGDGEKTVLLAQTALVWDEDDQAFARWHVKLPKVLSGQKVQVKFDNSQGLSPLEMFDEIYISLEEDHE